VNGLRARFGPLWPYVVLIGVPAAAFILPDLIGGHLVMAGDNVQQNYPLHVLVGSMLRRGQLPFWDPYIFSGTPLLAGFNAGALYPLEALFVILPDRVAWIATEVILFSVIAVGMNLFLRALALSTAACLLGALTFSCSGFVLTQANHVDMTEGFASIPFLLLAVLHIVRDGRWRWSVVLGIGFALVIFGGAPEAMLDEAILLLLYAALSAGFDRQRWWRVLTRCGAGAALALSLAAVQWLPGIAAIANSQRSGLGTLFAATGGFPPTYGLLALVPYLYGGYGHLGEAGFFSHYNLPEVGIYMGVLPLVALLALWRPRWPSRLPGRERLSWYLVGVVGILLALGPSTPLEHLFNAIPLYGHQRLQSRNMIDVAVAASVLFAGWIDRRSDAGRASVTFDRWVGFVPFAAVLGLAGWALIAPTTMITTLTSGWGSTPEVHTVREATLIALGFCLVAGTIVWLRPLVRQRHWLPLVAAFMIVDLGLIAGTSQLITFPSNAVLAGDTSIERDVAAHLSPGDRFDVYDPQQYASGSGIAFTGLPDDNVLARLPSVGGYASIVSGNYNTRTLTHGTGQLNVPLLASGQLDDLDLQEIVTTPEYFLLALDGAPTARGGVHQITEEHGSDPVLPLGIQANVVNGEYPAYPAPRQGLGPGRSSAWFFGETLDPTRAEVLMASPATKAVIRIGTQSPAGTTRWGSPITVVPGSHKVVGQLPGRPAAGLVVQVVSGHLPAHQAVVAVGQRYFELDGSLSAAVRPGQWRQLPPVNAYSLFVRTRTPNPVHVLSSSDRPAPPVTVLSQSSNGVALRVHASAPMVLVRDVAWDAGWRASVSTNGGASRAVHVDRHDLVQEVRLPAGTDVVTFTYRPPHWELASILSGGSFLFLLGLLAWAVLRRRRERWRGGRGGVGGGAVQDQRPAAESDLVLSSLGSVSSMDGRG
jgi:hypothetical protein